VKAYSPRKGIDHLPYCQKPVLIGIIAPEKEPSANGEQRGGKKKNSQKGGLLVGPDRGGHEDHESLIHRQGKAALIIKKKKTVLDRIWKGEPQSKPRKPGKNDRPQFAFQRSWPPFQDQKGGDAQKEARTGDPQPMKTRKKSI